MNRRQFVAGLSGLSATTAGCTGFTAPRSSDTGTTRGTEATPTNQPSPTRYELTALSASETNDRPPEQYILHISERYTEDEIEQQRRRSDDFVVMDVAAIDDRSVREPIETTILESSWRSEQPPPEEVTEIVDRVDIFRLESDQRSTTYFELDVYHLTPDTAIEFGATIVDETVTPDSPGRIELSLTNVSSTEQRVSGRNIRPFGVVYARDVGGGERFLLWTEYEQTECVWIDEDGVEVCFDRETVSLAPSDTVSHRYDVLPPTTTHYPMHTVPPGVGTYAISGELQYRDVHGAPHSTLSYEAQLTLDRL